VGDGGMTLTYNGLCSCACNDASNSGRWAFFSGSAAYANPGSTYFLTDSTTISSITKMSISDDDVNSTSYQLWLQAAVTLRGTGTEGYIQVTEVGSNNIIGIWPIKGMTDQTGYIDVDLNVTPLVANGSLTNGTVYTISWIFNGSAGTNGTSGTSGVNGASGSSGTSGAGTISGTLNYVAKFTPNTTTVGNSQIFDNGTSVGINTATPSASYLLDVNGNARVKEFLYMLRSDAAATVAALTYQAGGTVDIGTTFRVLGTDRWNSVTSSSAYIINGYTTKTFVTTNSVNGSFNSYDFSASNAYQPGIAAAYNQKLINGAMTIQSTAANNFFGLDIRVTDNSAAIANTVYGIFSQATAGTNTSATRWAGYFVGPVYSSINLVLGPNTSTSAPIDFTPAAAVLKTSPLAGDMEVDSNGLPYYSHADSSRGVMDVEQFIIPTATYTLTSQTAAQKLFNTPTNGALTVKAATTYFFECLINVTSISNTSSSFGFAIGGTATLTAIQWMSTAIKTSTPTTPIAPNITMNTSAANTVLNIASTGTAGYAFIKGTIRINAAGTIIPQISLTVANAGVVQPTSYFRIIPVGTNSITSVGNWS
jgi:hypothetical protein